ncbi:Glycosyltransferase involved in cell wall bisynthesis [Chitinophaga jiangningensis]|uniref:Glycosyltransferase involved in cell wall bisynthesis n=1 Tax=Chitinophaga jiangningensis TaxID=1419482 RepID=A0A1M7MRA6_9BACT|nr:glycosyltransferase [Chitinophaga jiangningensis]SHM93047.1 Glycosyltransferase involved in cell wall bisynthesis [Chitinophaga jiangningensis]
MSANRRIKVLETIHQGKVGGGERHILDLVAHLDKSRFAPVVLSFTDGPMVDTLRQMGIPVHVIPSTKPFDFSIWKSIRKLMEKEAIDMVHVHGTRANTNMIPAARPLGVPVIYTVHGWSFHHGLSYPVLKVRVLIEKWITRRTALNITVSAANRQSGLKAFGRFKSVVIRNGVDLQRFHPGVSDNGLRTQYGFTEQDLVVGFIVRMTIQKDPLGMIRAFAAAHQLHPQLKLLMIGEGPLKAAAVQLIRELGIGGAVVLDGFRSDVPGVLQAIDIYCLPSLWEGYPIGLLEAMAVGKPVIASDVDGTKEAFDHEVSGILVPARNTAALCTAICRMAADESLRQRFAAAALERARADHNITTMTRKVEEVYNKMFVQHEITKPANA